eukprot:TRINITY_DN6758_c0_g1_i2.p1 TRINITY_DN6758_c0_g1~~TRINITY_DN6758_c0_g1_i2.p1  ORF type:complete len:279 (-),score=21.24 TRINITY_DN6758_c0_g1_i2:183-1019(-)
MTTELTSPSLPIPPSPEVSPSSPPHSAPAELESDSEGEGSGVRFSLDSSSRSEELRGRISSKELDDTIAKLESVETSLQKAHVKLQHTLKSPSPHGDAHRRRLRSTSTESEPLGEMIIDSEGSEKSSSFGDGSDQSVRRRIKDSLQTADLSSNDSNDSSFEGMPVSSSPRRRRSESVGALNSSFDDGLLLDPNGQVFKRRPKRPAIRKAKLAGDDGTDFVDENIPMISWGIIFTLCAFTVMNSSYAGMLSDVMLPFSIILAVPLGTWIFLMIVKYLLL